VGVDKARAGQRAHAAGLDRPRHTAAPPSFLPTRILDLLQAGVVGPGVKRPLRPAPRMRQLRVGHGVQLSAEVVEAVLAPGPRCSNRASTRSASRSYASSMVQAPVRVSGPVSRGCAPADASSVAACSRHTTQAVLPCALTHPRKTCM
jgi:hypothetical protein